MTEELPSGSACLVCGSSLQPRAEKCPECGSYQRVWKNHLTYFSAVAGGLSLLAAAAAYVVGARADIRKFFAWRDEAVVLVFESDYATWSHNIAVANTGDGEIVLLGATYFTLPDRQGSSKSVAFTETVAPGKVVISKIDRELPSPIDSYEVVGEKTLGNCEVAMKRFLQSDKCLALTTYSPSHSNVQHFEARHKDFGNPVCVYQAQATLRAFSTASRQPFEVTFPVVSLLFIDPTEKCRRTDG